VKPDLLFIICPESEVILEVSEVVPHEDPAVEAFVGPLVKVIELEALEKGVDKIIGVRRSERLLQANVPLVFTIIVLLQLLGVQQELHPGVNFAARQSRLPLLRTKYWVDVATTNQFWLEAFHCFFELAFTRVQQLTHSARLSR